MRRTNVGDDGASGAQGNQRGRMTAGTEMLPRVDAEAGNPKPRTLNSGPEAAGVSRRRATSAPQIAVERKQLAGGVGPVELPAEEFAGIVAALGERLGSEGEDPA